MANPIGVGPALRKARLRRNVTIDEASRGTRIRADSLEALEDERFGALLGEVYVRGALRTYAAYLGLDPDKVFEVYQRGTGVGAPSRPEPPTQIRRAIGTHRRRGTHRLAWLVVAIVVIVAGAFGLLSRSGSTPAPAALPASPVLVDPETSNVVVGMTSRSDLTVEVDADGATSTVEVRRGEERTFEADDLLTLGLPDGGPATITINGTGPIEVAKGERAWSDAFSDTSVIPPPEDGRIRATRALGAIAAAREAAAEATSDPDGTSPTADPSMPAEDPA
ncbi:MAG: helix-turn-helix transcriptional regulator [Actinomycetota bacterium]